MSNDNNDYVNAGEDNNDGDGVDYSQSFATDQTFSSHHEARDWAKPIAHGIGFEIVISKINYTSVSRMVTYLRCNKGERYRGENRNMRNAQRKKTSTKACGCPFHIKVISNPQTGLWYIEPQPGVSGTHNHRFIEYPEGHRQVSGSSPAAKQHVRELRESQCKPSKIKLSLTQKFPDEKPTIRHLYNEISKQKMDDADGRNVMEQFIHLAEELNYHIHTNQERNQCTHVFMAHPMSITLLRTYPWVIGMDSTYKTNRYGMSLFEMIGMTPTNHNFLIGMALMRDETMRSYRWVLQILNDIIGLRVRPAVIFTDREMGLLRPIQEIFPGTHHLLCTWHINRDVEARVGKITGDKSLGDRFRHGAWARVMYASTEAEYDAQLDRMRDGWARFRGPIEYVENTWLPHKEKFVAAWANNVLHLGNKTTCRVESAHSVLKGWLGTSTNSIENLFTRANAMVEQQHDKIKYHLETSMNRQGARFRNKLLFSMLVSCVSSHCMDLLLKEHTRMRELADEVHDRCGCVLRSTCGIPCACEIAALVQQRTGIHLREIHDFWKTLTIGQGNDIPEFANDDEEEADHLSSLFEEVRRRGSDYVRRATRVMHENIFRDTDSLEEPETNTNIRGRPSYQSLSTRRDRSFFEHASTSHGRRSRNTGSSMGENSGSHAEGGSGNITRERFPYYDSVPHLILPFMEGWTDVRADGNCGFRCVADAFHGGQDNYLVARRIIANELGANIADYAAIYGGQQHVIEAVTRISWEGGRCDANHWMEVVFDLFPIANLYHCAIMLYSYGNDRSIGQCCTVLPTRVPQLITAPTSELHIAYMQNYAHYIRLHVSPDSPIPPVANYWNFVHTQTVEGWDALYTRRVAHWMRLAENLH